MLLCFFFKQKTAYEMRISDWSSDVCSSDLIRIKEDITDEVYAIITGSWAHFLSSLKGKRVDKDTSAAIDTAVELWTRRTRAIDAGALRICRFHAPKKEAERMLSAWYGRAGKNGPKRFFSPASSRLTAPPETEK